MSQNIPKSTPPLQHAYQFVSTRLQYYLFIHQESPSSLPHLVSLPQKLHLFPRPSPNTHKSSLLDTHKSILSPSCKQIHFLCLTHKSIFSLSQNSILPHAYTQIMHMCTHGVFFLQLSITSFASTYVLLLKLFIYTYKVVISIIPPFL